MTIKNNLNMVDNNERLIRDASDILLFLSDSFSENKYKMRDVEFLTHIDSAAQDVVYNLTQVVRDLGEKIK